MRPRNLTYEILLEPNLIDIITCVFNRTQHFWGPTNYQSNFNSQTVITLITMFGVTVTLGLSGKSQAFTFRFRFFGDSNAWQCYSRCRGNWSSNKEQVMLI